ncbi:MAG: murein biosynthesis integral membrane protein MurJ [Patescibacteria group bacterium]
MKNLLFLRQTNILSAAAVIAVAVLGSRVLGLVRDRLLTQFPVAQLDIYFAAFRLPDFIFQILVMGALTTAFIPVITELFAKDQEKEAWRVTSTVINFALGIFVILGIIIFIFSYQLSTLIAPGFNPGQLKIMSDLTRIMLIAQLFFILSNFLSAIIQSGKRFLLPAIAPIAYNLGIIIGIVFLSGPLGIYGPAWGVVIGTFLHFIIQLPVAFHLKIKYEPIIDFKNPHAREIGRLMLPRTLGLGFAQLSFTIDTILASLISSSSITVFNFASHLSQLPIGLFGATIAQAALPTLSEEQAKENPDNFKTTLLNSFHQILFLTLPATAILIVLRIPVVRLVFGSATFPWDATVLTGRTLAFLGLGIVAQAVIQLLVRGFYALRDSVTPVKIGIFSFVINIIGSLLVITIFKLPVWGLAISSSAGDIVNVLFLLFFLNKKIRFPILDLVVPAGKMFFAATISGICLYIPMKLLDQLVFDTTKVVPLIALTGTATIIGMFVYFFLTWLLEIKELGAFLGIFRSLKRFKWTTSETLP